ncbi:hypothetical protein ACEQ8H_006624 [Pleosporales sp. CAS-2024a]
MASLLTMPLELLIAVSSFISTSDLAALRLTCKQVEKSLYEWFSQEFFTKKQFMLTHKSLQALIDISRHPSLSKRLTHVIIATNVYEDKPRLPFRDRQAAALYMQGYQEQSTLLNLGLDREMLTEAFQNLGNLQTVGIRDFNNHERARDGINWTSWGAPTVYRETGLELNFTYRSHYSPQHADDFLTRVLQSLVYALARANRYPSELEVLLRRHSLPDSAFGVPDFVQATIEPVLSGLQKLFIRVATASEYTHSYTDGSVSDVQSPRLLGRFLGHTKSLKHLRLNLPKYQSPSNERFLTWLASSAPAGTLQFDCLEPPFVHFKDLTKLELGHFHVARPVLFNVMTKFASTLDHVELWKVSLSNQQAMTSLPHRPNAWQNFFTQLAKLPGLQLAHFKVGMLCQDHVHVQFQDPLKMKKKDKAGLKVKQYAGNNMVGFMQELADTVFVCWPERLHGSDTSGGDDDVDVDLLDHDDDEASL